MLVVATCGAFVAAAAFAYGVTALVERHTQERTMDQSERTVRLLARTAGALPRLDRRAFASPPSAERRRRLDEAVRIASNDGVLDGVTLWRRDGVPVYSSRDVLEGQPAASDPTLRSALSGRPVLGEADGRDPPDDSIRVLLPFPPRGEKPLGVLEVALPARPGRAGLAEERREIYLLFGAGTLLLWLALLPAARHLLRLIDASYDPRRRRTLKALERAIRRRELELYYQPQVNLSTGRPATAEALVRWRRGEEIVPPAEFLPYAESSELIEPLTDLVIDKALAQAGRWYRSEGPMGVSVNLSAANLRENSLPRRVQAALTRHGVPARLLTLEVTETAVLRDPEQARTVLERLAGLGVRIAVDDFGTGYSSLLWLQLFPVSEVKIDRAFVAQLLGEGNAYVSGVVRLAHDLNQVVVGEGVEDEATLKRLHEIGCDVAQGYLFAPPLTPEELERWLRTRPADAWARRPTEMQIAPDFSALRRAREFVASVGADFGFEGEALEDIKLAADEALTNAIEHGGADGDRIDLRLVQEGGELALYISNSGTFRLGDSDTDRGRGIALMTVLMDEVDVKHGTDETLVRLAKRVDRARERVVPATGRR